MSTYDCLILGSGASGLMCALTAAQRGRSVMLLDHYSKLAEKIRISGGGNCNFTNLDMRPDCFVSANPHFVRSALARYTPRHFTSLLDRYRIGYHEKTTGQLFCDAGSEAIIAMLRAECETAGVRWSTPCEIQSVAAKSVRPASAEDAAATEFTVTTNRGIFKSRSLVVATGGLSIPKIGATPFGYKLAEQFGLPIVKLKPGLVPLSFTPQDWAPYADLTGVTLDAEVSYGGRSFRESLLFTHRGLSGPAILQISTYWEHGQPISINLLPDHDMAQLLEENHGSQKQLVNFLSQYLPKNFAQTWSAQFVENKPLNQLSHKQLRTLAERLHNWQITPSGTLGYTKAEVTCGGVDTRALSSKTMQVNTVPGLYFIGEVVDVTGQLGGYNLHWAWASGYAAGQHC
ncbi:MAG: NAD(P)/FAD-dependent oxidoreductase [Nitrosomonadales bacterium]|nr:NAD(P)/FAD-dependent oxidoreductase [Nitrosomonadales bacterium]